MYIGNQTEHEKVFNITSYYEIQVRNAVRYHLTPVSMAIIKKIRNDQCQRGYRKKEVFIHY